MVNNDVKVIAIIQARLGSERLPQKALLPLPFSGGPTLLEHVVKRATASGKVDTTIVATTDQASDDPIYTFCQVNKMACYRGHSENVLNRFVQTANQYKADVVVRLTGDNPFIQPATIDLAVQKHIDNKVDYTLTEGLPLGTNVEVISFNALQEAAANTTDLSDQEHVTPYIRREKRFKTQSLKIDSGLHPVRLTVDYPSDYALASMLYEKLYQPDFLFDLEAINQLINDNPWLPSINIHNSQKKVFISEAEEIREATELLKKEGLTRVLDRLNNIL